MGSRATVYVPCSTSAVHRQHTIRQGRVHAALGARCSHACSRVGGTDDLSRGTTDMVMWTDLLQRHGKRSVAKRNVIPKWFHGGQLLQVAQHFGGHRIPSMCCMMHWLLLLVLAWSILLPFASLENVSEAASWSKKGWNWTQGASRG